MHDCGRELLCRQHSHRVLSQLNLGGHMECKEGAMCGLCLAVPSADAPPRGLKQILVTKVLTPPCFPWDPAKEGLFWTSLHCWIRGKMGRSLRDKARVACVMIEFSCYCRLPWPSVLLYTPSNTNGTSGSECGLSRQQHYWKMTSLFAIPSHACRSTGLGPATNSTSYEPLCELCKNATGVVSEVSFLDRNQML